MNSSYGRWKYVRDVLDNEISSGILSAGSQIATENQLSQRFDIGRHSIRRAIAALVSMGKLRVDQGRGTFVEFRRPIRYVVSQRTRFHPNLISEGRVPSIENIFACLVEADKEKAERLKVNLGDLLVIVGQRSFADGEPIHISRSYHPAQRFPEFLQFYQDGLGDSAIYSHYGIDDYLRHETIISARLALDEEAEMLQLSNGQPVIVMEKCDVDLEYRPIGYAVSIWAAEKVQFAFDTGRL
ncbi:phosphonate metabolism transcriptional regulator PhnF [Bartonella sp. HY761]|uniref:phosphonate metabolism transcriptional regulator PhnF n=1 Tax=Bartonella sp. HY761 TaxID=2979330 RepID=UPI0022090552|nr:phosphonate metabolism transcriptional regulator PhnF [Bartonella sp. HY761]UXN05905.1 phosphonate metabolism transcriptional regulator PhnF [Bartonella sp. HY761]